MENGLVPVANSGSAVSREFGLGLRWFARRYFDSIRTGDEVERTLATLHGQGRVVHVMRSTGRIRFAYLAYLLARLGLPPLRAAVGLSRFFGLRPWRRLIQGAAGASTVQALQQGGSALVFLKRSALTESRGKSLDDPFPALVAEARKPDARPIFLLPELLVWERNPGRVRPSFLDALFGSPEAPSGISQLMAFLRNYSRAFVRLGEPINLSEFVSKSVGESDEVIARKVRGALSQHLSRQTRAIVGPKLKEPERVVEETLRDRTFHKVLEKESEDTKRPMVSVESEARKDLREIAAKYSPTLLATIRPFMSWIFNRLYDGVEVDESGLKRALDAGIRGPLIFCPSHKSHIDYLLIAWVFAERGLASPHAAAGANLSFFPLGTIFRRGGAFFLRRSFKGDRIYTATFRAYVKKLLREGVSQEFYIEGGRSRTGKLLNPKTGLLSFEFDAFQDGACDDAFFVPVAIDYEKIVESKAYEKEMAGGEKQKEDVRGLLSAPKVLAARYGRIYLSFEEPISLREFMGTRPKDASDAEGEKRKAVAALAHRIVFGIDRASTVTPSALLASVLLGHRQRGMGAQAISDRIHFLRELAESEGARIGEIIRNAPTDPTVIGPFNEAVGVFEEDGLVTHQQVGGDTIYRVVDERRQQLVFYKNNFMHLVAPRSLVAASLRSFKGQPAPLGELRERTKYLSRLFKLEFIFKVGQSFDALFEENLTWLTERGLVMRDESAAWIAPEAHAQERVALLAELVRDFTESYWLAAKTLHVVKAGARERKELVAEMLERGRAGFLEGQLQCAEAVSRPNLENALELYVEQGVLTVAQKTRLSLSPAGEQAVASRSLENEIARFL